MYCLHCKAVAATSGLWDLVNVARQDYFIFTRDTHEEKWVVLTHRSPALPWTIITGTQPPPNTSNFRSVFMEWDDVVSLVSRSITHPSKSGPYLALFPLRDIILANAADLKFSKQAEDASSPDVMYTALSALRWTERGKVKVDEFTYKALDALLKQIQT